MDSANFILVNPFFRDSVDHSSIALFCEERNINSSIKYFWKQFIINLFDFNNEFEMKNFPISIFDKATRNQRDFLVNQSVKNNTVTLSYNEIGKNNIANYDLILPYEIYTDSITKDSAVSILINQSKKENFLIPRLKRKLYLTFN